MHKILVVRHAIALNRLECPTHGVIDAERPLTQEGIAKMELAARGLARLQPRCALILTSPLLRAEQTAKVMQQHYPSARVATLASLAPQYSPAQLIASLQHYREETIAIVGHEPGLSHLIASLLGSRAIGNIALKKGGAALLDYESPLRAGEGILRWLLTPKQLRLVGKR